MAAGGIDVFRQWAWRGYKRLETKVHQLRYLFFEVTRRCNLACIHCGSDCSQEASMPEMTLASWISIMDYVKAHWNPFIVVTGGEPLVRPDLCELTAALANRQLVWGMVTNGLALDQAVFDTLVGNGLSSITLSLDGDRDRHQHIRRHPRAYDQALAAMNIIGASSLRFKDVVTCVYPGNLDLLQSLADQFVGSGMNSWRLFRIFPKGKAARHPELFLDHAQSWRLVEWIRDHRALYRQRGLDISFSCEGYLPFTLDRQVRPDPFFCRAGINIASILSDGTITGCNNNGTQYHQGNVAVDDFHTVWENGFTEYRDRSWLRTGRCAGCAQWRDCQGGSIHLRDKTMDGPQFCYVQPPQHSRS
jgi:radical SAM protein with 4Fe4S-binding SPASM domain